ncbi:MAG: DUF6387 family protein [Candidatus Sedimenticola sp. (ex Thyasira tokunagai)]
MNGKLIKSYRDFPEWFKEKVYEETIDPTDWIKEIKFRFAMHALFVEHKIYQGETAADDFGDFMSDKDPFAGKEAYYNETMKNIQQPVREIFGNIDHESGMPVTIDLDVDDETIIESVKELLKIVRDLEGDFKRPYAEKDFNKWSEYKILQVHDLDMWYMISGKKITDNALASVLWPDSEARDKEFSPIDRLRKVSREKIKKIITLRTIHKLEAQISIESMK